MVEHVEGFTANGHSMAFKGHSEALADGGVEVDGAGHAETEVPFAFTPNRSPRSSVVHEAESTATDAGHAGTAGGRAACLTLPTS